MHSTVPVSNGGRQSGRETSRLMAGDALRSMESVGPAGRPGRDRVGGGTGGGGRPEGCPQISRGRALRGRSRSFDSGNSCRLPSSRPLCCLPADAIPAFPPPSLVTRLLRDGQRPA